MNTLNKLTPIWNRFIHYLTLFDYFLPQLWSVKTFHPQHSGRVLVSPSWEHSHSKPRQSIQWKVVSNCLIPVVLLCKAVITEQLWRVKSQCQAHIPTQYMMNQWRPEYKCFWKYFWNVRKTCQTHQIITQPYDYNKHQSLTDVSCSSYNISLSFTYEIPSHLPTFSTFQMLPSEFLPYQEQPYQPPL